uniref:Uncharacterized protein n=1 Tax=Prymnesium polylepis TaxID=72548 RepID=A0A7S4MP86_9EUKA
MLSVCRASARRVRNAEFCPDCALTVLREPREPRGIVGLRLRSPPVRCVRPLRPGSPMHQRAARAHPVDGERSIGKLVQLARLEIAKKLMPLSAGQRARVDAAAEGG